MNDESIDVNLSFINTDYFSVSVRDGYIRRIATIKSKAYDTEIYSW